MLKKIINHPSEIKTKKTIQQIVTELKQGKHDTWERVLRKHFNTDNKTYLTTIDYAKLLGSFMEHYSITREGKNFINEEKEYSALFHKLISWQIVNHLFHGIKTRRREKIRKLIYDSFQTSDFEELKKILTLQEKQEIIKSLESNQNPINFLEIIANEAEEKGDKQLWGKETHKLVKDWHDEKKGSIIRHFIRTPLTSINLTKYLLIKALKKQ